MATVRDYHAPIILPVLNLLVVVMVGITLILVALQQAEEIRHVRTVVEQGADSLVRSACNSEGFKKYPDALQNPDSLAKLIAYNEECVALNGLPAAPAIKLP